MNRLPATPLDMFKCDFCQFGFVDQVKVVICGTCHDDLNSPSDSNRQFQCKSCHKDHSLPQEGLADVKALMQMLKLKPEKLVTEKDGEAEVFKNQIEEVREKINRLESFNSQEEINVYCDSISVHISEVNWKTQVNWWTQFTKRTRQDFFTLSHHFVHIHFLRSCKMKMWQFAF